MLLYWPLPDLQNRENCNCKWENSILSLTIINTMNQVLIVEYTTRKKVFTCLWMDEYGCIHILQSCLAPILKNETRLTPKGAFSLSSAKAVKCHILQEVTPLMQNTMDLDKKVDKYS